MIRDFTIEDYDAAMALWKSSENIGLSPADERDKIKDFLDRNPGLSKVAVEDGRVLATALCGHDGRRGYLYHVCVDKSHRRKGLGKKLVSICLDNLASQGIDKCHLFIFDKNTGGQAFWAGTGWQKRDDILVFSRDIR